MKGEHAIVLLCELLRVSRSGYYRWSGAPVTARERMAKLIKEGKTEEEIYAAKPFADFDAKYAANEQAAKNFVRVVYFNLKK